MAAINFAAVSGTGAHTVWESPWSVGGIPRGRLYGLGFADRLVEVGVIAPYSRSLSDVEPLAAGIMLIRLFLPEWTFDQAKDWILRAFDASARDREIAHAEAGIRINFKLTSDGRDMQIYVTRR